MKYSYIITIVLGITILSPSNAIATCYGTGNMRTCNDNSGNSYKVTRFGNNTYMQGNNVQTGSHWSQNSQTFGNTTTHKGNVDGNNWHMTEQQFSGMKKYNGVNAAGQAFSYTCTQYGGCTGY